MVSTRVNDAGTLRYPQHSATLPTTDDEESAYDPTHFGPVRRGPAVTAPSNRSDAPTVAPDSDNILFEQEYFDEHTPTGFMPGRATTASEAKHHD